MRKYRFTLSVVLALAVFAALWVALPTMASRAAPTRIKASAGGMSARAMLAAHSGRVKVRGKKHYHQGPITPGDRRAAAQRALRSLAKKGKLKAVSSKRLAAGTGLTALAARAAPKVGMSMTSLNMPDYFGMTPNYANSQLPAGAPVVTIAAPPAGAGAASALATATVAPDGTISGFTLLFGGAGYAAPPAPAPAVTITGGGTGATATATVNASGVVTALNLTAPGSGYLAGVSGGIRKFVDTLPGLGSGAVNDLGQYIPVGVADTTSFPGSDYYEIAVVQYTEKLHADLAPTTLRGYVQIDPSPTIGTPGSNHVALLYPAVGGAAAQPILDGQGQQVYAYDNPQYLGPTILAHRDRPVRVKFDNYLPVGAAGDLFLPVDTTVMGAGDGPDTDPAGGMYMYQENRATLHLHGGVTPWISDGTPHQWTVPVNDTSAHYQKGVSTTNVPDMPVPGQGSMTFYYTNQQSARLMFYHDHSYGTTRLNVYGGEAAGYLLDDPVEQTLVTGGTIGTTTVAANTVPKDQIPLVIQDKTFVPSATQLQAEDPTWDTAAYGGQGNLWFPHVYMPNQNPYDISGANMMGRWDYGPWFWPPYTGLKNGPVANPLSGTTPQEGPLNPGTPNPSLVPEGFMDTPLINGTAYPVMNVDPKAYRLRVLNASNDRFWNLQLYQAASQNAMWNTNGTLNDAAAGEVKMVPAVAGTAGTAGYSTDITDGRAGGVPDVTTAGPAMVQIGTEGGILPGVVDLPNTPVGYNYNRRDIVVLNVSQKNLFLGPAERADVIVDFSQYAGKTLIMYNDAPAPVPAFDPRNDYYTGDPDQTTTGGAPSTLPGYGPNTRTVMMIKVANTTAAPAYDETGIKAALPAAFAASQDKPIVPETAYNAAYPGFATHDNYVRIADTSVWIGNAITSFHVLTGGSGYTSAPTVNILGGGGSGAAAHAVISAAGVVTDVVVDAGGSGYTSAPVITLTGGGGTGADATAIGWLPTQPKAIQELFTTDYGRMNATLGVELPFTNVTTQTTLPYGYAEPVTENINDTPNLTGTQIGTTGDGTQIWKITHNGVDTHAIHFHLFNVQVINRVGWDGAIRPPDPNELGWKDTVRMNPLEDCIVALRPTAPKDPWGVMNSVRPTDPTMPTTASISTIDPATGNAITVPNTPVDFGWEYVWHCHLLGHEENDMMRPIAFHVASTKPDAPVLSAAFTGTAQAPVAQLTFTDGTPYDYTTGLPASTLGNPANEVGFHIYRAPVDSTGTVTGPYTLIDTGLANKTIFNDATAAPGTAYSYEVGAYNQAGEAMSNATSVTPGQFAPAAPTNLTATLQAGPQVALAWTDNATNEDSYIVERSANGGAFNTIVTLPANTVAYTDATVTGGNTYTYQVRAVLATIPSAASNPATVIVPVVAAPTGLTATLKAGATAQSAPNALLSFTDNATDEARFVVERQVNGGGFTQLTILPANPGTGTVTTTDVGLTAGVTYDYRVRAENGPIVSAWATATLAVPATPATPAGLTATLQASGQINLAWTDNATNETAYVVERSVNGGAFVQLGATLPANPGTGAMTSTDTTALPGNTYAYRVMAVAIAVPSAYSNTATVIYPGVPATPTSLTATLQAGGQILLSWNDNALNETTYVVERAVNNGAFAPLVNLSGTPTTGIMSWTDTGVAPGTIYAYRVKAMAGVISSLYSNVATVNIPPVAPSNLTFTIARSTGAADTVTLRWTDNSTNETLFVLERASDAGFTTNLTSFNMVANVTSDIETVVHGSSWYFRVQSVNLAGGSAWSNTVTVNTIPAVPTNLHMTARTRTSIAVAWNDTSSNETGFQLQERRGNGGTWATITTTAANGTAYTHTGLKANTTYQYRVRAINAVGNSAWSTTLQVTTLR